MKGNIIYIATIYLLPGLICRLTRGLGVELQSRGFSVTGRETVEISTPPGCRSGADGG